MASGDLLTLQELKRHLNIADSTTTDDEYLKELITSASAFVKRYTGRDFLAANFRESIDGNGRKDLWLNQWPIIDIRSITAGTVDAIQVKYSGTAARATVEVEDRTSLKLKTVTGGTESATTLAFATYPTLTTLVAQIAATSDWTASRMTTEQDYQDSYSLMPFEGGNARNTWLVVETEDEPDEDYHVDGDTGRVTRDSGVWIKGRRNYTAFYSAGYGTVGSGDATNRESLPADLTMIVKNLCKFMWNNRNKDDGLQSERLADYSYVRPVTGTTTDLKTGLPKVIIAQLDWWTRPRLI